MLETVLYTLVAVWGIAVGLLLAPKPHDITQDKHTNIESIVKVASTTGLCTGFIVGRGLIATAGHCTHITDPDQFIEYTDGVVVKFKVINLIANEDCHTDWAILMADTGARGSVPLGLPPKVGDRIFRIGYPGGKDPQLVKFGWLLKVSLSSFEVTKLAMHGESGSPVFGPDGRAFGIVDCMNPTNYSTDGGTLRDLIKAVAMLQRVQ